MERRNTLPFQLDDLAFYNAIAHVTFSKTVTSQFHRHFKEKSFKNSQMKLRGFERFRFCRLPSKTLRKVYLRILKFYEIEKNLSHHQFSALGASTHQINNRG